MARGAARFSPLDAELQAANEELHQRLANASEGLDGLISELAEDARGEPSIFADGYRLKAEVEELERHEHKKRWMEIVRISRRNRNEE